MTIEEAQTIISPFVDKTSVKFQIDKVIFVSERGRKNFNDTVRKYVSKKLGIYLWVDRAKNEIIYIGMAGRFKTDGTLCDHSLQERLLASRGKDKQTGKDVLTNDYVRLLMDEHNIDCLDFYVMYAKEGEPPAYIEALLLYTYYKKNSRLPRFNSAF